MATNWDSILSNTKNLNDVLAILRKVLASLGAKADITTIDEALKVIDNLDISVKDSLGKLAQEIVDFNNEKNDLFSDIQQYNSRAYPTLSDAQADIANIPKNVLITITNDGDNDGWYRFDGTKIIKSDYDPLIQSKEYADEQDIITKNQVKAELKPMIFQNVPAQQDIALSFRFENGQLTWLAASTDGTPPQFVIDHLFERLNLNSLKDAITEKINSDLEPYIFKNISSQQDIAHSVRFSDGTLTWLAALKNGTPPQFVIDHLASRLGIKTYNSYSRIDKITCLGDSLTEGGTGDGTTYPNFLKDMMPNGTDVINKGGSGQLSLPIGLRYGAITLKLNANTIPTSGSVKFTFSSITDTVNGQPFNAKRNGSISGTIAGVKGVFTLSTVDGNDEFVPSVYPSSPVAVPQDAIFYPDLTNVDYEATLIFWSGQNDLAVGWPYWETAPVDTARACVNIMQAEKKKVIIIGVTTTSANALGVVQKQNINLKAYVSELVADGHDAAFLDIQADLTNLTMLAILGIDTTNQDVINSVNAGLIPKVATADEIHFTATIKKNYTAYQIKRIFATKGWL